MKTPIIFKSPNKVCKQNTFGNVKRGNGCRENTAIFSSNLYQKKRGYTLKLFIKRTSVDIKNMWIKQVCSHTVYDFHMAFRVRKLSGTLEKQVLAPSLLKTSAGRILRRYRWGHGFKSHSNLLYDCLSCVYNCDDQSSFHTFHPSSNPFSASFCISLSRQQTRC